MSDPAQSAVVQGFALTTEAVTPNTEALPHL